MDSSVLEKLGFTSQTTTAAADVTEAAPGRNIPGHLGAGGQQRTMESYSPYVNRSLQEAKTFTSPPNGPIQPTAKNSSAQKQYSASTAKKDMDAMRKRFNDELLRILEEEQHKEN